MPIITVSQINRYIGSVLKGDRRLQGIMIKGEISNFVRNFKSGHCYFSLKDAESSIRAVMFAGYAARLKFQPVDGMAVVVSGSLGVYERDGAYQVYVTDIIPEGAGKESVALEQLKKKLAAEGIFAQEHKRPIPHMPRKIGAVTSLSGAAIQDIKNVLTRRYPMCELYAVNAVVQGENAPQSICNGIFTAESLGCDVIIVGRGGGSSEDLGAFNNEAVARAIYNCKVPVISAVGHEVDFTIADMAADMRAPTPSAAAELASPDIQRLAAELSNYTERARKAAVGYVNKGISEFNASYAKLTAQSPENRLRLMGEKLDSLTNRAHTALERRTERCEAGLREKIAKLDSLSPLKVMARGYSLVYSGEELVRDSGDIAVGDTVKLRFDKGGAEAEITKIW